MFHPLTFEGAAKATSGTWIKPPADLSALIRGAAFDTRNLGEADIFFALESETADGHTYLDALKDSKVKLILVHKEVAFDGPQSVLRVKDSTVALQAMARARALHFKGRIVTITGSSGKTTAKTWLSYLLTDSLKLYANQGSFNNHIGCPVTILDMPDDTELLILEMGTSGLGELDLLSSLAPADFSLILNVGHAHLGHFGSLENTYKAKLEIFNHLKPHARRLIPANDVALRAKLQGQGAITFGPGGDYSFTQAQIDEDSLGQSLDINLPSQSFKVRVNQLGAHVPSTLSALFGLIDLLGIDPQQVAGRCQNLPREKGRANPMILENGAVILDDTYNANPESVVNMLQGLMEFKAEYRIAVVGNMTELEDGFQESLSVLAQGLPEGLDALYLTGKSGALIYEGLKATGAKPQLRFFKTLDEVIQALKPQLKSGVIIGVKGSRSSHMERVVLALSGQSGQCDKTACFKLAMCQSCEEYLG